IPTGEEVARLEECSNAVAFSPDNSLAVINRDLCDDTSGKTSRVIQIDDGQAFLHLPINHVYQAEFNPEGVAEVGRYLVLTNQRVLQIWDVQEQRLLEQLALEDFDATAFLHIAFDPRGRYLAVGTTDGRVWVVDMGAFVAGSSMKESVIFNQVVHTGPAPVP